MCIRKSRKRREKRKKKISPSFEIKKPSTHTVFVCVLVHRVALLLDFCFFFNFYILYIYNFYNISIIKLIISLISILL